MTTNQEFQRLYVRGRLRRGVIPGEQEAASLTIESIFLGSLRGENI